EPSASVISRATRSRASRVGASKSTRAPSRASSRAVAAPMPLDAPVTSARVPVTLIRPARLDQPNVIGAGRSRPCGSPVCDCRGRALLQDSTAGLSDAGHTNATHAPGGATTKETTMSNKTLLLTVGALALAACDSPTAPNTVPLEAMVLRPPPIFRLAERIAFRSARAGAPGYDEIYVMNQEGVALVRLTNSPGYDGEPALSRDGSKVAFASFREGTYCCGVYVMNAADGSGVGRLTTGRSPAWSHDGSKIAFTRSGASGSDIFVINADHTGVVQLTSAPGNEDQPAWSPDGSKIAFRSWRDGSSDIYVMSALDGSGVLRLTTYPSCDGPP